MLYDTMDYCSAQVWGHMTRGRESHSGSGTDITRAMDHAQHPGNMSHAIAGVSHTAGAYPQRGCLTYYNQYGQLPWGCLTQWYHGPPRIW